MNTVHFRVSQISIPPFENEDISYSLSVHIGQTFIEYPLQIEEKIFLKSPVIVSFNYDSASDYEFHVELLEQKKYSDQIELASIDIPIRICKGNRQVINGCLDMEIKDKSLLDNVAASTNENLDSDDEYDSEEDAKSIKIFIDIHRSENNKQRFTAPLTKMRDLNTAFLTTSRQSFDSSCSFAEQFNKKKSASNKSALSLQENEDEVNQENEQRKKKQDKEELEEEQQISDEKEQTINQDDLNEDENNQDSSQIQQIEDQNEQESLEENSQIVEEEEEHENDKNDDDDIKEDDDKKEEKEEFEIDSNDDKIDSKGKSGSQNKTEELMAEDSRPSRHHFLSESESDDNEIGEDNENNSDQTTKDSHQINDFGDDDESIPPVELNSGLNQKDDNDEGDEKQLSIHRSLSSDSAQFKVYPPRNLIANAQMNKEAELSEPETNEQVENEHQQLSENQDETEPNEQQGKPELELSEEQEDPKLNEHPEEIVQQEDQMIYIEQNQQQKEQSPQIEIEMPPLSVSQQQSLLYPQLNEIQIDVEPPVQQQAPILRFSSLDMQNFECLDNFSFYPTPEQIGSYYIPPSLLPISIHPPFSD